MGLLMVRRDGDKYEVEEHFKRDTSLRLRYDDFLYKVRQRAAAILTYRDALNIQDPKEIWMTVNDPEMVACWTMEVANFLLSSFYADKDFYFGICIEKTKNVKKTLGRVESSELYELLSKLPKGYLVDVEDVPIRKPREVSIPLMLKEACSLSRDDVKWIREKCEKRKWNVRILLYKKVWKRYELLSKREHIEKVKKVISELTPLKRALTMK